MCVGTDIAPRNERELLGLVSLKGFVISYDFMIIRRHDSIYTFIYIYIHRHTYKYISYQVEKTTKKKKRMKKRKKPRLL